MNKSCVRFLCLLAFDWLLAYALHQIWCENQLRQALSNDPIGSSSGCTAFIGYVEGKSRPNKGEITLFRAVRGIDTSSLDLVFI